MTTKDTKALLEEVEALKQQLAEERQIRSEVEAFNVAMSSASHVVGVHIEERPTGKTVTERVCVNPWVRKVDEQKWIDVEKPTYFFTIDLPVNATCLSTNGIEYYHGQTYEFTMDQLAEMKCRVARCWDHERMVHGENENAYRQQSQRHLRRVR